MILVNALTHAYPDLSDLNTLLQLDLGFNVDKIAGSAESHSETVLHLVSWAEANGKLQLFAAARRGSPGDLHLAAVGASGIVPA